MRDAGTYEVLWDGTDDYGAGIIVEPGGSPVDDTSWSVVKSLYR